MQVDDIVYVDTDDEQWGRIASDGIVLEIFKDKALVNIINIRSNVLVPLSDISENKF